MMVWVYTFEDGTVLKLIDTGLTTAEICKLQELHHGGAVVIDLIEGQAAIDMFNRLADDPWNANAYTTMIEELPSAEPERKKGKWIHGREISRDMIGDCITAIFYEDWKCSECGYITEYSREPLWKYCPYCGAAMKGW